MRLLAVCLCIFVFGFGSAQDLDLVHDREWYDFIDRCRLSTGGHPALHPGLRSYDLDQVREMLLRSDSLGAVDPASLTYRTLILRTSKAFIEQSSPDDGFWDQFYINQAFLFSKYGKDFFVRLNPLVHFSLGHSNLNEVLFTNARGFEISGGLNDRFFFYSNIVETQLKFPSYIQNYVERYEAIPGNGFYKPFKSQLFDFEDGYDFLNSEGYLSVKVTDNVGFQLGHGKHFFGNGRRSLLQSDFSNNAFYFQADWKFWKIHYRNLWQELRPRSAVFGGNDDLLPRKYSATHHLSVNVLPNLNFGIFESVVFYRSDQFELGYMNPIILYRTIEQSVNSPDNVLLGFDILWDVKKKLSIYGQLIFDEFKLDELIFDNRGWWGNKLAYQLGVFYPKAFGVEDLNLRIEFNEARPYTYSHRDSSASYSHYQLPLAHPLGANFSEILFEMNYRPVARLRLEMLALYYRKGLDSEDENYGGDVLKSNATRVGEYDNFIGQGINSEVLLLNMNVSYRLFEGLDIYGRFVMRESMSLDADQERFFEAGIRYNLRQSVPVF